MEPEADFDEIDGGLADAGAQVGAAESHGMLCGLYCATGRIDEDLWRPYVLDRPDAAGGERCLALLRRLGDSIAASILSGDMAFRLLLPDDAAGLGRRSAALGAWCQGMLFGLGLGGAGNAQAFPEHSREMVADLERISRIGTPEGDDPEGDERAFFEVSEYVRIGALLICEELRAQRHPPGPGDQVH